MKNSIVGTPELSAIGGWEGLIARSSLSICAFHSNFKSKEKKKGYKKKKKEKKRADKVTVRERRGFPRNCRERERQTDTIELAWEARVSYHHQQPNRWQTLVPFLYTCHSLLSSMTVKLGCFGAKKRRGWVPRRLPLARNRSDPLSLSRSTHLHLRNPLALLFLPHLIYLGQHTCMYYIIIIIIIYGGS